jgi:hypothetical protein
VTQRYLLVLAEREAVAWVLRTSRMAFPALRRAEVARLAVGDELFLLTTRGCWHNPSRDRTRVIGRATVGTPVAMLPEALEIADRSFTRGCDLIIHELTRYLSGVELAPLVSRMTAFPDPKTWSIRLRRPLLAISDTDAALLRRELGEVSAEPGQFIDEYLDKIVPVRVAPIRR